MTTTSRKIAEATKTSQKRSTNSNPPPKPPSTNPKLSYLSILSFLKLGLNPAKIAAKLNVPKQTLQYHLSKMKRQGLIRKVGYGTWEIIDQPKSTEKEVPISRYVGFPKPPPSTKQVRTSAQSPLTPHQQDAIRTHAITTTWQVPHHLRNWNNEKRTQYLHTHDIPHIQLKIAGGGQRIIVKNRKVQLLNRSIIIYDKASYFAQTAREGKGTALALHLSIIKHIERILHTSFQIGDDHKFRVSRQHHALIHNAIATQYNEEGEKLEVRDGRGLWLLIDNSKDENGNGMNELEAVRSDSDNKKVQDWLNGLKAVPADRSAPPYTPATVLEMIAGVTANQEFIAANMTSHVEAIQNLSAGVKEMNETIRQLQETQHK